MRILVWMLVVMFALTVLFFVPRLGPVNPIEAMLAKVSSQGAYMDAAAVDALRASLADTFGLGGSLTEPVFRLHPSHRLRRRLRPVAVDVSDPGDGADPHRAALDLRPPA